MIRPSLTVAGALLLGLAHQPLASGSPASSPSAGTQERRSLEDILKDIEVERARFEAETSPKVASIMEQLDALRAATRTASVRSRKRELVALGPDAAPLLVAYLDPGTPPVAGGLTRAEVTSEVLAGFASSVVTDDLVKMARTGGVHGRKNALRSLESCPEPQRATGAIISIASGKQTAGISKEDAEEVRIAAFGTLAAFGTPESMAFIQETLTGGNLERASAALMALSAAPVESSAETVLGLLADPEAHRLAAAIASYYGVHEFLLEDFDHARQVGQVAVMAETSESVRIALFDLLRLNDSKVGTPVKRKIETFTEASRSDVRLAAHKLLARMKDKRSRKAVLAEFDARVKEGRDVIAAHTDRALILHELGDWNGAVKDWRAVMKEMAQNRLQRRRKEPYIGIARSLARMKKYREAAEYLESAPISLAELQGLAAHRDFAGMLETKYGETFHVND